MFSVYAGNARSSCLVVGAVAKCSTHAGLPHWSFDRRNCCVSVGRSMSWRQLNAEDGDQCPSRVGRYQPGMQVSDPLATGAPDMQPCSQLVDEQKANAADAAPAWCDRIDESRWPDVLRRSGSIGSTEKGRLTYRTTKSCSSSSGPGRNPGQKRIWCTLNLLESHWWQSLWIFWVPCFTVERSKFSIS